jgi:hypothetical protein
VVNLGAGWGYEGAKGVRGMPDADFLLETQVRKYPKEHLKALRAQWVGDALNEEPYNGFLQGRGGPWNVLAHFKKRMIVAEAKPATLAALGAELGEANESAETKAMAVAKAAVTDADRKIVIGSQGTITIPAAACGGGNPLVKSFLGGQQMIWSGPVTCEIEVPRAGTYALAARVVTLHGEDAVQLTLNGSKHPLAMAIPYTIGSWQQTAPVEVALVPGKNTLSFSKPATSLALKEIVLTVVR